MYISEMYEDIKMIVILCHIFALFYKNTDWGKFLFPSLQVCKFFQIHLIQSFHTGGEGSKIYILM